MSWAAFISTISLHPQIQNQSWVTANEHCCHLPKPPLQNDSQMNELQIGHEMVLAPAKENEVYKQTVVYPHLKAKES